VKLAYKPGSVQPKPW